MTLKFCGGSGSKNRPKPDHFLTFLHRPGKQPSFANKWHGDNNHIVGHATGGRDQRNIEHERPQATQPW